MAHLVHLGVTDTEALCDAPITWEDDATTVERDVTCSDCITDLMEYS